jgi:hypothetical protein
MKQKKDVAVRTDNNEEFFECLSCNNTIINPICPDCLRRHFKEWVKAYPELERVTIKRLNNFVRKSNDRQGFECILCKKKVYMCVYCFSEYLYELIKRAGAGPRILSEFLFIFNYDFKRNGYIHDLEAYGNY